jgi:hypothetical protein
MELAMGFVFGIALLVLSGSYAHAQRNTDVHHPPPNFVPGDVKQPATSPSESKSPRAETPKPAPADKIDQTGGVKPRGNGNQKGQ